MSDEIQPPLTGDALATQVTKPIVTESSDWKPPTREEWEAEQAKKARLEADLHKHRTRAEQVETERKAREEAELKSKPLEEQLEAERLKREELESELSAVKLEQYNKRLDDIAEQAGVPERLIDVAAHDWARSLDAALESAGVDPDDTEAVMEFLAENEALDFDEWLEQEEQATYKGTVIVPKSPTAPAAPTGSAPPLSLEQQITEAERNGQTVLALALRNKARRERG